MTSTLVVVCICLALAVLGLIWAFKRSQREHERKLRQCELDHEQTFEDASLLYMQLADVRQVLRVEPAVQSRELWGNMGAATVDILQRLADKYAPHWELDHGVMPADRPSEGQQPSPS